MLQLLQMQQLRIMAWQVKQMIKDLPDIRVQPQPGGLRQVDISGAPVDPGPDIKKCLSGIPANREVQVAKQTRGVQFFPWHTDRHACRYRRWTRDGPPGHHDEDGAS